MRIHRQLIELAVPPPRELLPHEFCYGPRPTSVTTPDASVQAARNALLSTEA